MPSIKEENKNLDELTNMLRNSLDNLIDCELNLCKCKDETDLERKKRLYRLNQFLLLLSRIEEELIIENDPLFDFTIKTNTIRNSNFLSNDDNKDMVKFLIHEIFNNHNRILRIKNLMDHIKDIKFQKIYTIRNLYYELFEKIFNLNMDGMDYILNRIHPVLMLLDKYLLSYINSLMILANEDYLIDYLKENYENKCCDCENCINNQTIDDTI